MRRRLNVAYGLFLISIFACAEANTLKDGSYFAFRGTSGDPWLNIPSGGGDLVGGSPKDASVFFIKKIGGSSGNKIRSGDYVKIRGTAGDPWLSVPSGGGFVFGGSSESASTFVIKKILSGSSSGLDVRVNDYIKIRATDGDPWLIVPSGGGRVKGGAEDEASTLFIAAVHEPIRLAEKLQQAIGVKNIDRIQLGWTKILPCSKMKWVRLLPDLYFAEQRIYAYAKVNGKNMEKAGKALLGECAAAGAAACGIASLIASPGACVPSFTEAFSICIKGGAADVVTNNVHLYTETKCMW